MQREVKLFSAQYKGQIECGNNQGNGSKAQTDECVLFVKALVHIVEAAFRRPL